MPSPLAHATGTPAHSARKPLSLGVIFLTLYIDLIGFSVAFPLAPKMLQYYLGNEASGGPLSWLLQRIQTITPAGANASLFEAALFGGVLASVFGFLQFIFAPIWGARSDRIGRRPVLLLTVAGTAFSYVIWIFSGSFWMFVLSRVVGGAMSGNLSVATAAVADVTTRENRAKGMGIVGAAFGLGFITGPAIGGMIGAIEVIPALEAWGINPFSAVAGVALFFSLVNLVWISARFSETLNVTQRENAGAERTRNPLAGLFGLGSTAARRANMVYFLFALLFSAFEATVSFLAAERLGYNERQLVMIFVFIGITSIITQGMLVRRIMPKIGERAGLAVGLICVGVGLGVLGFAIAPATLYSGLGILGVGSGFANVALSALVSLYSGTQEQGRALGVYRSLGSLARALGPLWAGLVFWWLGSQRMYSLAAVLMVIPFLVGALLPRPQK